jgi:hypothetical protein
MSERRIQPVTRIRGELQPAPAVVRAVNRFLEQPLDERRAKVYTTAQVVVDQGEDRRRHAHELSKIEREMGARSLAKRAFVLARLMHVGERPDGSGRLFFSVDSKDRRPLEWFGDRLEAIEGLEEPDQNDLLYVEIARGGLAGSRRKRREKIKEGREKMAEDLEASSARYKMTASGLHVVTKDMLYPVSERSTGIGA